tara:strand:- start:799 stop:1083 length:285 start_codon:yes stop_codon:yes gene_type:complete
MPPTPAVVARVSPYEVVDGKLAKMSDLIKNDYHTGKFHQLTDLVVDLINLGKTRKEISEFLHERRIEDTDILIAYQAAKTLIKVRKMPLPPSND